MTATISDRNVTLSGSRPRTRRLSVQIYVSTLFVILILSLGALLSWLAYTRTREVILLASEQLTDRLAQTVGSEFGVSSQVVAGAMSVLDESDITSAFTLADRLKSVGSLVRLLNSRPEVTSTYAAYPDGDFFMLRRLRNDVDRMANNAPPDSAYMVQSTERSPRFASVVGTFIYLDQNLNIISKTDRPDYRFDPRTRIWFDPPADGSIFVSPPYPFFSTREIGITLSMRTASQAILGADLSLATLSSALRELKPTPSSMIVLADEAGNLIATSDNQQRLPTSDINPEKRLMSIEDLNSHLLTRAFLESMRDPDKQIRGINTLADGKTWLYRALHQNTQSASYVLIIALPESELLDGARQISRETILASIGLMIIVCPIVWAAAHLVSRPLHQLADEILKIEGFDFDRRTPIVSQIVEIDHLTRGISSIKHRVREFMTLGRALGSVRDLGNVLEHALMEITGIVGASAGVLFLLDEEGNVSSAVRMTANGPVTGHAEGIAIPALLNLVRTRTDAFQFEGISEETIFSAAFASQLDDGTPLFAVVIPLRSAQGALVGVILLARTGPGSNRPLPEPVLGYVSALAGTAAIAINANQLYLGQKALLEAFIQVLGNAIDAKSAYTGGHCQRVPVLAEMMAHAAQDADQGTMKDFHLSEEDWEAVHIGAWLHDCGKVTTPEFVMDKATKLETIYNRIHEVRMRFEVIKREAEVACWQRIASGADKTAELARLDELWLVLDEEFAFIAECNLGGEAMSPDAVARLRKIAERTWTRTLDNSIGVSATELALQGKMATTPLPAIEQVLADRPDHVIERSGHDLLPPDNPWGIRMQPPEHLYNFGELHNLSVFRGTLTAEERYKINDHIIQTIIMLSRLPFPPHLKAVPEIAATHHERVDGKGYPRGLTGNDMSTVAKMMAIADVFEALTAADRPYKPAKPLSQSLAIMDDMAATGHFDPQVYKFFRESSVWRDYAQQFLSPDQIDM
ncbi:MAG: GAF domain-containing protein [Parvibaculaceae bacterium]|nr:GAF domain-containing protein [Parvibaculaceae bacterium]